VILWKAWLLRARPATCAQHRRLLAGRLAGRGREQKVAAFDREALVLPLIAATDIQAGGTLAAAGDKSSS
jgi:biopolymer transport protein ExbB